MEKINIAEILRDCPRGMELDCPCFENVRFDHVDAKDRIRCLCGPTDDEVSFTAYGTLNYSPMAKVVLFPKGQASWEGVEPKPRTDYNAFERQLYNCDTILDLLRLAMEKPTLAKRFIERQEYIAQRRIL